MNIFNSIKTFYNFLYLHIYNITTDDGLKESTGSSLFAYTALQTFNFLSIVMALGLLRDQPLNISKWLIILFYLGLSILNYFLYVYYDKRIAAIKRKWESVGSESKYKWKKRFVFYIILSIILFGGLVFIGALKHTSY